MKKLAKILAVAGLVLAMSAPAQANMILDDVDSIVGWSRQHSCPTLVNSTDTVDGLGSIEWTKSGPGEIRSGVVKFMMPGAPLDLSEFGPTDLLAVTFKLPVDLDPALFIGIGADLGNNLLSEAYEYSRWTVDAADVDMVFGEWVVAEMALGDGVAMPGGTGCKYDAVSMVAFHVISTYSGEIPWMRLDKIAIIPEPATMVLLGLGGIGLLFRRKRR